MTDGQSVFPCMMPFLSSELLIHLLASDSRLIYVCLAGQTFAF